MTVKLNGKKLREAILKSGNTLEGICLKEEWGVAYLSHAIQQNRINDKRLETLRDKYKVDLRTMKYWSRKKKEVPKKVETKTEPKKTEPKKNKPTKKSVEDRVNTFMDGCRFAWEFAQKHPDLLEYDFVKAVGSSEISKNIR